ncbi:hypothetical protein PBY51_005966 [Eleginops maclovinus]|uniref:Uncharacterized protein n=1 Tax=Eleginops maclovinus TaxID=56733 RepID=A0AAN7WQS3_ELEMC|nr:hypothetical protein PBY51_005966 [Eleginops maclovinus]
MSKCPAELIVKSNVCYFFYAVGGLLMTVTGGSVDVTSAQNPAYLLRLSNTLMGLMGLRHKTCVAYTVAKRKLKRLFFTESFNSLLAMMRTTLQTTPHFKLIVWCPETQTTLDSANCILARRYRIYYILICGVRSKTIITVVMGNNKLKAYSPSDQLQWLISFISKAQEQRDVVYLLLDGRNGSHGYDKNGAANKRPPSSLTLGLSALSVVFLWMFLPHFAVFAVICLGWKVQQNIH